MKILTCKFFAILFNGFIVLKSDLVIEQNQSHSVREEHFFLLPQIVSDGTIIKIWIVKNYQ